MHLLSQEGSQKKIYKTKQMHDEYTNKDKGNMADEIFHDNFLFG